MRTIQATVFTLLAFVICGTATAQTPRVALHIEAQPMRLALKDLGEQTGLQIMFRAEDVGTDQMTAPRIAGELSAREALEKMLENSGLKYRFVNPNTVLVSAKDEARPEKTAWVSGMGAVRLAQAAERDVGGNQPQPAAKEGEKQDGEGLQLEEVVVTGTHIRGTSVVRSPMVTITRAEIEMNGYTQAQQILGLVPQNFGGGSAEGVTGTPGREPSLNAGGGQGANLRGLGSSSTLVLLDGHRLAPAGYGNFIDISLLPVTAIERVEVITDGASAIYGADAVGGVVNFILRDDFQGSETKARYGATSQGGAHELSLAQTFGMSWGRGNAILSYEHFDRGRLPTSERSFSENALQPQDLLPGIGRDTVFVSAKADVMQNLSADLSALYSDNEVQRYDFFGASARIDGDTETLQINGRLRLKLGADWQTSLSAGHGKTVVEVHRVALVGGTDNPAKNTSTLTSLELTADGAVFELPAGAARLALGTGWRREDFAEGIGSFLSGTHADRNVASAYFELAAPVFDFIADETSIGTLALNIAGRYEDYSDFGDVFTPKVGADLALTHALKLRASYSKAFRAPIFFDMSAEDRFPQLAWLDDPVAGGQSLLLYDSGSNPDLEPERAKIWTAGIDLQASLGTLSLTYFDIDYRDRIIEPITDLFGVLAQEDVYRDLIDRNPDPAHLTELGTFPGFVNFTVFPGFGPAVDDPALATLLIDGRIQNVATTAVSGLDVLASRAWETRAGLFSLRINGTYLFEHEQRITEAAQPIDLIDTAFNPLKFRAASQVSWTRGNTALNLLWNYANSYRRTPDPSALSVDSWSTLDFGVRYNFSAGAVPGMALTANVRNIFDSNPPALSGLTPFNDYGYDPTNASPIGRFMSVELRKSW